MISNTSYQNSINFSNVHINSVTFQGQLIDLSKAVFSSGGFNNGNAYSNSGTITIPNTSLPSNNPFLANTSNQIDGGGGTNTVVYRANRSNYSVTKQSDGSYLVTSTATAEGPDTLTNIQILQFADQSMNLN